MLGMSRCSTRSRIENGTPTVSIPADGSHPRVTENTMMSRMASQKTGTDTPRNAVTVAA
jgi:hypothetical protein